MAFDDALIGSSDFDPRTATEDLIRHVSDEPLPSTLDVRDLNTRLARKLGRKPLVDASSTTADNTGPLDFSSQAAPPPPTAEPSDTPDFSTQAVDPNAPAKPPVPGGIGTYASEFGKAVVGGAKDLYGTALKGAGAVYDNGIPATSETPQVDAMGNVTGTVAPPQEAVAAKPVPERTLYKVGQAIQDYSKDALAPATGWENSWTRDIGQGAGSMIGGLPIALIPGMGPYLGGAIWTLAGSGEATENAVKAGATTDQTERAALLGGPAGATDMVDLVVARLGSTGKALGFIKRVGVAAVKGAMMEGGQEAVQQLMQNAIAKGIYKPDQDMFEDVPRSFAVAAILGGVVGGGSAALHRDATATPSPAPAPSGSAPATAGGLPPPPPGGPRSSPEDIRAFNEEARRTNPNPQPDNAGPARPRDPATMDDTELSAAFQQARADMDGKSLDEILRAGGYSPETIKHMDERGKVEEAIGVARSYQYEKNQQAGATSKPGEQPSPEAASEQPASSAEAVPHADYAVLRAYGYSDEDIANMPAAQRKREVNDAFAEGIKPGDAMKKYPQPQQAKPSEAPVDRGGAAGTRPEPMGKTETKNENLPSEAPTTTATGTRTDPIEPQNAADVAALVPVEPKSPAQAEAENFRHAHAEIRHLGLTGHNSISIETGKGQVRNGTSPDGKPWSVTMNVPYGRVKATKGADGQPLDIFIGEHPTSPHVFVLNQLDHTGKFDETKILAGFRSPMEALRAYSESYSDQAEGRIGGMVAMTPEQFRNWIKTGDHSKSVEHANAEQTTRTEPSTGIQNLEGHQEALQQSEGDEVQELGRSGDQDAPGMGGELPGISGSGRTTAKPGVDLGSDQQREGVRSGQSALGDVGATEQQSSRPTHDDGQRRADERVQRGEIAGDETGNSQKEITAGDGRSIGPHDTSEIAEPTAEHHQAVEDALGPLADNVAPVDIARAAELMAENEGMTPETAFGRAVIENAVDQGFITKEQAEQAYGPEVKEVLDAGREGPSGDRADVVEGGPASEQERAGGAEEGSVVPGSGEAGAVEAAEIADAADQAGRNDTGGGPAPAKPETAEQPAAEVRPAENEPAAEAADKPDVKKKPKKVVKAEAVAPTTLADAFQQRFADGEGFVNILQARKVARDHGINVQSKENGWQPDSKVVEEAIELAVVKTARGIIEASKTPKDTYDALVSLYARQPRLGTRTSTSIRDQAYSTPAPLGYLAQRLAGITKDTTVYEPTAGNGALLTTADPAKVTANEINPDRAANLKDQGFKVTSTDGSESEQARVIKNTDPVDVVIANPPFGAVKEGGESKVFDLRGATGLNYKTTEIDHAIALRSLAAMKDDGRAVLLLGGVNKMVSTEGGRADAYQGQSKRLFYKALYDTYNVTDHFTVAGELYERQGAGWPVDVVVIQGRGKSALPLPAVSAPRIYKTWDELGGLLNGQSRTGGLRPDRDQAGVTSGGGQGLEGTGKGDRSDTGSGQSELGEPAGVRGQPGSGATKSGEGSGVTRTRPEVSGRDDQPARSGEQPAAVSDDELDALLNAALDNAYGKKEPATGEAKLPEPRKPRDERTTPEVAKSATKAALDAADEGFSALYDLFGGNKASAGFTFDEDTYAKAKPHFEKAAGRFKEFWGDLGELFNRMVEHLRDAMKFTREGMERIIPYLKQFVKDRILKSEPEAPRKEAVKSAATETENQVAYKPASKVGPLETLAPVNMAKPMADALRKLEDRVGGSIDQFVADELGMTHKRLQEAFGAEQVDALGLAIDNIKNGKGFIIGDQTGIGKGRVNAAIIQWAMKNGRVPVFVTEKPGLYKDMYRDMAAIGVPGFLDRKPRILATNGKLDLPLEDGDGARIQTGEVADHNKHMVKVAREFGEHYDMVFTTYNQMQTQKGEDTARRQFLQHMTGRPGGVVMIFDESHNAGGQKETRKEKGAPMGRAEFSRDLIQKANGVFYSSATYAKRPDVMDLYSATNMSMAVDNISDLAEAIAHGRIPMQQVVASMLAKDGQYMRRERSFAGINYNTATVPVDRDTYDNISISLSAINDLSAHTAASAAHISKQIRGEGSALASDGSTGGGGASSTNFTSIMHNVINQMLLGMKADQAATRAIELIKKGEKPVLTVANTMEAFMKDYVDQFELKPGDEINGDFSHVLKKYLDRTRTILITKPFAGPKDKPIRHVLTDEELGPAGVAVYNRAKAIIEGMDLSGMPISPIDYIKGKLKKAGYEVGEITGRTLAVDYSGKVPIYTKRPGNERTTKGKVDTLKRFNTRPKKGGFHALIINQSGSTGLSAHASVDFDDQSKRHMMIVQPEGNIDTHMQLLGRINRTGQVVLPEYTQLNADIPAEIRPASVLAKKMASLNANTTASRDSAVTSKEALDFLNEYGDQVAVSWIQDNPEIHYQLGSPVDISETGKPNADDAMRKITGRLPMRRLAEQEAIYEEFTTAYRALIEQLEAAGENTLEAKSLDLKAKLLEKTEVQGKRNNSGSQFAAPVYIQKVSIARIGKPFKPAEVIDRVGQAIDAGEELGGKLPMAQLANILKGINDPYNLLGKKAAKLETDERQSALKAFDNYMRPIVDDEATPEARTKKMEQLNAVKDRWTALHRMLPIGKRIVLKTESGNLIGIVLDVSQRGEPKNPLALGTWNVKVAIADATRQMTLPFSRLYETGKANPDSMLDVEVEPMTDWYERHEQTLDRFEHMQHEAREERYIAGGNMLAAYDWLGHKGAIINYTAENGSVHQGILPARGFDPGKQAIAKGRIAKDPAEIKKYLDDHPSEQMMAKDGFIGLQKDGRYGTDYVVTASKAKNKGGKYYLDKALTGYTGDFSSRGGSMVAYVGPAALAPAIRQMQKLGAEFRMASSLQKPMTGEGGEEPTLAAIGESSERQDFLQRIAARRDEKERLDQLAGTLNNIVRKIVGPGFTVEFHEGDFDVGTPPVGYNSDVGTKARGQYVPGKALIRLALTTPRKSGMAAFHESYHGLEDRLLTPQERKLMERETPRLRQLIKGDKINLTDEQIDKIAGYEVRSFAFQLDGLGRTTGEEWLKGEHVGVRRWFEKLRDLLRKIGNYLRGLGFQTYKDIFRRATEGEYANRPMSGSNNIDVNSMAATAFRPGGARPGPNTASETIAEHLRDRGHDRMAGLLQKLGIGKINATEIRVQLQDKFARVKNAERSVDPTLPSAQSTYQAESLYFGRTGERLEAQERDRFDPLIKEMHTRDISPGELNEYLYAKHAPERNAYIDTINPGLGGAGSGMSDTDAANVISAITRAGKLADYQAVERMARQIINDTRDNMVAYGLISQETADQWAAQYQSYVPLRGFEEASEDEGLIGRGRGYDTRGKEVKPAFGRRSMADGPLQYIMMQAESAIVRGEKNRVGNTFLRFVRANPDMDRWQVNAPTLKRRIDARTGLVTYYADFNYHNEPDAFVTKVGGKPMVIRLYGRDGMQIARALKQIGSSTMNPVVGALHTITSLQSRLSTMYNPNFLLPNFTRDLGEALINLQAQDQQRFVQNFMGHLMPALKGTFNALRGTGHGERYADAFREFDKAGGRIRFFGYSDPDDIARNISKKMRQMQGGAINNARDAAGKAFTALEIVNGAVENATRLAAYMAARDAGMSAPDSAMLARNLTVDFNKKGELGPYINAAYMFGNAQIQGSARLARALMHKRVRQGAYALAALGALGALFNILAGGDDDDGDPYYSKIKPYIRDKNLILMWPKGWGHDGKYIKIPLPFGFSPFHVLGDRMMGVALGKDKPGAAAWHFLGSVGDAFNPLGEESSPWMMLVPSLLRPGIHIATNKNWTGNPIYPEHDYDKNRPDSVKSFKSNSDFSKWSAEKLNALTGGSPYKSGWFDVHPGSIDHVLETATGGAGKFVMDVVKTGTALVKGDGFDETKAPIIRRFVGSTKDPQSDAQAYYETRDEARKAGGQNLSAARKDMRSGKNQDEAQSFVKDNPKAQAGDSIFKQADSQMKPLRGRLERIESSTEMDSDQKRREKEVVIEQMRTIQNTARKRYKEMREGISP